MCVTLFEYWPKPAHMVWSLPVVQKSQAPAYSVSDKGLHDQLKPLMVFQPKPVDFNSRHNPSQAFPENMCHTHD